MKKGIVTYTNNAWNKKLFYFATLNGANLAFSIKKKLSKNTDYFYKYFITSFFKDC